MADTFEFDDYKNPALEKAGELAVARRRILYLVSTLVAIGIVMVYSASAIRAQRFGTELFFLYKQIAWLGAASVALVFFASIDYHCLRKVWPLFAAVSLALLVAVRVPGIGAKVNGAYRWIHVGGMNIGQPSELAKLFLIISLAAVLSTERGRRMKFFSGFLPAALLIAAGSGLVAIEPDFGTAALIGAVLSAMLVVGGARVWQLAMLGLATVPPIIYLAITKFAYIEGRVAAWLAGSSQGKGYQPFMSRVALGSGGPYGMGLGKGAAKQYFLPDAHTDFILAVTGQELGLIGTLLVVLLFCLFVREGMRLVQNAPDRFGALLSFGIVMMIGLQAAFNMAVVTGAIPPKGISLPFISFGGSGLCIAFSGVGILLSVTRGMRARKVREAVDLDDEVISEAA